MINVSLLKEICELPGVPGHEQKVRELIQRELKNIADDMRVIDKTTLNAVGKTLLYTIYQYDAERAANP